MSANSVEAPCEFVPMATAHSLEQARDLSEAMRDARLPAFVITATDWDALAAEADPVDVPTELFRAALGGVVVQSRVKYSFTGAQPCNAHVDEVPENLLPLKHHGMFNIHHVLTGAVTVDMVYTRPGYYQQDTESRLPITGFNFGITEDLRRRRRISTYTTEPRIHEARLAAGDRVVFFERTSRTVDGPPNVLHLFHSGTSDRYSEITHFYTPAA